MPALELDHNIFLDSWIVYAHGRAVGIVDPSFIYGQDENGTIYVSGSRGVVKCGDDQALLAPLVACGAFIHGTPEECDNVALLLNNESVSRTVSWICTVSTSCAQVLSAIRLVQMARVLIVGCGGIGSLVGLQLAGAGISAIGVIDPDVIEESNLNRQFLWQNKDIGASKVKVFEREAKARYPQLVVRAYNDYVDINELEWLLPSWDAVVVTADSPIGIVGEVVKACLKNSKITVSAGYRHKHANCTLWENHSYIKTDKVSWVRLPNGIMPSVGPTNVELAGIAAGLVLRRLSGISQEKESICIDWDTQAPFQTRVIS